jgi:hypothetical protein
LKAGGACTTCGFRAHRQSTPPRDRPIASKVRLLPSTSVTRLHRYYEPLRHPIRPGRSLTSCRLVLCNHRWGFPCCVCFPVCACCRHYPGRTDGSCSLVLSHQLRPSPRGSRVGSCIARFEAYSTFILVTACTLTESLFTTLSTEGFSDFVASTAASIVTGWNEPVPGRVYLPLKSTAFSRRTPSAALGGCDFIDFFAVWRHLTVLFSASVFGRNQ